MSPTVSRAAMALSGLDGRELGVGAGGDVVALEFRFVASVGCHVNHSPTFYLGFLKLRNLSLP